MSAALTRLRLGPARLHGSTLVLRLPRAADFPDWRRLRLRDRALLQPFWHTSPLDWDTRHSERRWVRECLEAATNARTGRRVATVIEVDGRFAGQVEIGNIDPHTRQGEMGIWIDARLGRLGFGGVAAGSILDFGFDTLGLERIIAPISPANAAATHGARQLGFIREGRMVRRYDVGGARIDHDLWSMTRAELPPKGFTEMWIERTLARGTDPTPPPEPLPRHSPGRALALSVAARYRAGQVWRIGQRMLPPAPVTLPLTGHPGAVLRTPDRHRLEFPFGTRPSSTTESLRLHLDLAGVPAGDAWILELDLFDRTARIQFRADPAHADDDVRTAATRALLAYAFEELDLFRISTAVAAGDTASAAVAARAGLHKEATMRSYTGIDGHFGDHDLWAVTADGDHDA
ncbi:GNAT family N-acetyltransferase [Nocardia sp. NBC_00511]|uniref:GNAT family N-acetyltransferase n=1 Tax=Nocardia sp. NBC_00511 TaxID=2903591 RepID=UPI0030E38B1D